LRYLQSSAWNWRSDRASLPKDAIVRLGERGDRFCIGERAIAFEENIGRSWLKREEGDRFGKKMRGDRFRFADKPGRSE